MTDTNSSTPRFRTRFLAKGLVVLLGILLAFWISCCRQKSPLIESAKILRNAIPKDASSFYIFDGAKFKDSPLSIKDLKDGLQSIEPGESKEMQAIKKHGTDILNALPQIRLAELINGAALYSTPSKIAFCAQAASLASADKLVASLTPIQTQNGFAVHSKENQERVLIEIPLTQDSSLLQKDSLKDPCLSKEEGNAVLSPNLLSAFNKESVFAIGQFTVKDDMSISSSTGPVTGTITGEDIPIKNVYIVQSLDKTYRLNVTAPLDSVSPEQTRLVKTLERPKDLQSAATSFPGVVDDAAFALTINHNLLDAILIAAIAESSPEQAEIAKQIQTLLANVSSVSLSILQGNDDAIFPDLALALPSSSPDELFESLKTEIQKLVSSQIPMANWLEKETGGVHFNYVQSPLGVGVYIAKSADKILISTSENGIIQNANRNRKQLDAELQDRGFPNADGMEFISLFANAPRIAGLVESVQSSLSLFTGGQSTLNNEELGLLRSLSLGRLKVAIQQHALVVDVDFLPKTTTQKP